MFYRRSTKAAFILFAVAAYLLFRELFLPAGILFVIGAVKLAKELGIGDPTRSLKLRIRADAGRHGLRLPFDGRLSDSLQTVYVRHQRAVEAYPTLAADYDAVVDSMWEELRQEPRLAGWHQIVRRVADHWTTPWSDGKSPLDESLGRLKRSTRMWQEAQREVHT